MNYEDHNAHVGMGILSLEEAAPSLLPYIHGTHTFRLFAGPCFIYPSAIEINLIFSRERHTKREDF